MFIEILESNRRLSFLIIKNENRTSKSVFICLALVCNVVLLVISKIRIGQLIQVLQTTRRIEDEERKFALLEILSDQYSRTILDGTLHKPKSAIEISQEYHIPFSTVYRRLQTLHDNKLMAICYNDFQY